jgi:hypothetical protein
MQLQRGPLRGRCAVLKVLLGALVSVIPAQAGIQCRWPE